MGFSEQSSKRSESTLALDEYRRPLRRMPLLGIKSMACVILVNLGTGAIFHLAMYLNEPEVSSNHAFQHKIFASEVMAEEKTEVKEQFLVTDLNQNQTIAHINIASTHANENSSSFKVANYYKIPAQSASEQYLYYLSHSGWSNQLLGLYHAAQLAYSTNRTLIVPPILSHHTTNDMGNARGGGNARRRCGPDHRKYVKLDAKECRKSPDESSHVKFSEIINMTKLSQALNVSFTDLCDFIKEEPALAKKYFFHIEQMKREQSTIDLSGSCTLDRLRSYTDMVKHFETIFARDDVAIIPSAFILDNTNSHTKDFQLNVFNYPPTSNLSGIVRRLRSLLPTNYIGVHLRYRDNVDWAVDDEIAFKCSGKMAGKTEVLDMIRRSHMTMIEQNKAAVNSTPSVYFASNSQKAIKCYKHFFNDEGVQAFSLKDLLVQERNNTRTREFFSAIKASTSTILLSLDQILVSFGQQLVLSKGSGSSFQHVIKARHRAVLRNP